jgi:carbon storage regulator
MLVLSRKQTQELLVGEDITITVLEVKGHVVRLGIQAPRNVRILRGELAHWDDHVEIVAECAELAAVG